MSQQITTAFVEQYKSNVIHLSQQEGSRFRAWCRVESVTGKSHFFERIGATEAVDITSRHSDTPLVHTPHSRRRVQMVDKAWADLVDIQDDVRILISPASHYAINGARAMGRACDDLILAAARGNAYGGVAGATTVALPSGQKVPVDGTNGLTIAKLLLAKKIFDTNDVPGGERVIAVHPQGLADLLGTTQVTSSDYNSVKALVQGDVDTFMGFKFIMTNRLATASTTTYVLAWQKEGMALAVGKDLFVNIEERADKNYATQVYMAWTMGATRVEDEKVVEIACYEA